MKPFKPFINLMHYTDTGDYVLNAVMKMPSNFSVVEQQQAQVDKNWVVTLRVREFKNMNAVEKAFSFEEFSIKLDATDMQSIDKIILQVKDYAMRNGDTKGSTTGDPGDADDGEMPS